MCKMEEKAGGNIIPKAWTVGGFIIGVAILAIFLITQSKILVNHDLSAALKNWDENNRLLLNEISSSSCVLNGNECKSDSLVLIDAVTRYEFHLILAGEMGHFEDKDRNNFSWTTAHIIDDLKILHLSGAVDVQVSRSELSKPFGLLPYMKTSPNDRNVENNDESNTCNNDSYYVSESDLKYGRIPIHDMLSGISTASSDCALDLGCASIQMIFYAPPVEQQPLHVISSPSNLPVQNCGSVHEELITGFMIGQGTSIVVMNSGLKDLSDIHLESILSLSRKHLKRLLGLDSGRVLMVGRDNSGGSEGINREDEDDLLSYKIKKLPILFAAAVKQLNALRDIVHESSQIGHVRMEVTEITARKYNEAVISLNKCQERIELKTNSRTNFNEAYTFVKNGLELANDLSVDPLILPPLYFPLDQELLIYAPYWVPIIVPLVKGLLSVISLFKKNKIK